MALHVAAASPSGLSAWKRRGKFVVSLRDYDIDFRTAVDQLQDYLKMPREPLAVVRVRPYRNFVKWAQSLSHYDDRHYYPGIKALVLQERLPRWALDDYESKKVSQLVDKLGVNVDEIGLSVYLDQLAAAIARGDNVPPLVTVKGQPIDGRHRTLAALRLGLHAAPVMEVAETFGAASKR